MFAIMSSVIEDFAQRGSSVAARERAGPAP
jgi:hypothetical protein